MAIKQTEADVGAVSDRFYDALTQMTKGDAKPMLDLWPHHDHVSTMHPLGGREIGWDEVKGPWQAVADMAAGGEVRPSGRYIRVVGDAAYELVDENVTMSLGEETVGGTYRATNVYEREDGEWRIVHHHSDIAEDFIEVVQRLGGDD